MNHAWLMMSSGMKNSPLYIGDYNNLIQERGIPIKHPGFNGMIIRDFVWHCSSEDLMAIE